VSVKETAHKDPANHAAARWLILPIPRLCSLAPSVTTPLYSLPSPKRYGKRYEDRFVSNEAPNSRRFTSQ
jgi:hypothetical protein